MVVVVVPQVPPQLFPTGLQFPGCCPAMVVEIVVVVVVVVGVRYVVSKESLYKLMLLLILL